MKIITQVIQDVENIYQWVDEEVARTEANCRSCSACCDFERFEHRLFVTTPELLYFLHFVGPQIKDMPAGVCPYCVDGNCSVYAYRFSGCRIFYCDGDSEAQNQLSEQTIRKFKVLCEIYQLPYLYMDLKAGLKMLQNGEIAGISSWH